jgi:hypothetical protein
MHGRSCFCLLIVLVFSPAILRAQAENGPPRDLSLPNWLTGTAPTSPIAPVPDPPGVPFVPTAPLETINLEQMTRAAGMIFSGQVTGVVRHPGSNAHPLETVSITFHVEQSIRGASPGSDLTITQWMGVWSAGQRYRVGERAFLFLYPPSKLGLTSCVNGPFGRFQIDAANRVWLSAQQLSAFRKDPVLGGKLRVIFSDFALAVERAGGEESAP